MHDEPMIRLQGVGKRYGAVHAVSPVCTHMGCHVHWNNSERSWDCPCHGARYSPTGEVLNGPAVKPLESKKLPRK